MTDATPRKKWKARLTFTGRLALLLLLSGFLVLSDDQRAAVAQAITNPMSVLAARSPGERESAALRQTKTRREMVLPLSELLPGRENIVSPEDLAGTPGIFADADGTPLMPLPEEQVAALETLPDGAPGFTGFHGGGGFLPVVPGGGGGGGGGGDGGGGGGGCDNPAECGTPTIPVPEPASWALIMAGFFTLGGLLRSAHRAKARLTSGSALSRAD